MTLKRFFLILLLVGLAGCGFWSYPAWGLVSRFAALPAAPNKPVTFLLAGVGHHYVYYHTRGTTNDDFKYGLSDTMVVVQFNPKQKALKLLSIPRDTHVGAGSGQDDKINAAVKNGFGASVRAVEGLLGLKLDGYAFVSIDGTRELVNALGGVRVYVPQRMEYQDNAAKLKIDLQPGWQVLNGQQAEGFIRFRKDNLGDIGRSQRQQSFFRAVIEKLREPATWTRAPQIAQVIDRNVRTNLDRRVVGAALGFMLTQPRVDTLLLPGDFGRLGRYSFWIPDARAIRALTDAQLRDAKPPEARRPMDLSVAIVSSDRNLARAAQRKLRSEGFNNVWIADVTPGNPEKTTILSPFNLDEAKIVRVSLGVGEERISGESVLGADLTVRVGKDFKY
jgi:polyisoprenyl-teichoic acid--peptidoglycan teichoic acid transferase